LFILCSGSNKEHGKQQPQQLDQDQPSAQQAAELAQMMAMGYLPGLDPAYLSYLYPGLPGFFPGMSAMPMLQPGLLPGESMLKVVRHSFLTQENDRLWLINLYIF
jgi:hypothetical protein